MIKKIAAGIIPVFLGGLVYLLLRPDSLLMFDWIEYIGLSEVVQSLRAGSLALNPRIPGWIKFNLPDALWIFSFTYLTLCLWDFKINRGSACWIFLVPVLGLATEFGQLIGIVPGTFDSIDLIFLLTGTLIPFFFISGLKPIKPRQHDNKTNLETHSFSSGSMFIHTDGNR